MADGQLVHGIPDNNAVSQICKLDVFDHDPVDARAGDGTVVELDAVDTDCAHRSQAGPGCGLIEEREVPEVGVLHIRGVVRMGDQEHRRVVAPSPDDISIPRPFSFEPVLDSDLILRCYVDGRVDRVDAGDQVDADATDRAHLGERGGVGWLACQRRLDRVSGGRCVRAVRLCPEPRWIDQWHGPGTKPDCACTSQEEDLLRGRGRHRSVDPERYVRVDGDETLIRDPQGYIGRNREVGGYGAADGHEDRPGGRSGGRHRCRKSGPCHVDELPGQDPRLRVGVDGSSGGND